MAAAQTPSAEELPRSAAKVRPISKRKTCHWALALLDCDSCSGWKSGGSGDLNAIRIMPMGDSITLGVGGDGYREDLGGMLGSNATTVGHWVLGTHI